MKRFEEFQIDDKTGYPSWVRGSTVYLTTRISSLGSELKQTDDINQKIELLSDQLRLISYMLTMSIGIDTEDKTLLNKAKRK